MQPESYLHVLDSVITLAAERGMYSLLDLQWLDAHTPRGTLGDGQTNYVPVLPDVNSIRAWTILAERYRNVPAVLYDLFNEPHDPLKDDASEWLVPDEETGWKSLSRRRVGSNEWHRWADVLVAAIREKNPAALIFVSGLDWGYDLGSFPLSRTSDVVYSSHVYPSKRKKWSRAFGDLTRTHPVFIGEWGGTINDLRWGEKLVAYLDELNIGWAAWSWSDHPHLVEADARFTPTRFGEIVRNSFA